MKIGMYLEMLVVNTKKVRNNAGSYRVLHMVFQNWTGCFLSLVVRPQHAVLKRDLWNVRYFVFILVLRLLQCNFGEKCINQNFDLSARSINRYDSLHMGKP